MLDNTRLAKMMSAVEQSFRKALWEVGKYLSTCSCIRPRTTKENTLRMELSRTNGHRLLSSPFGLPGFCSGISTPCSMVLFISSLSKMTASSPAIWSAKASLSPSQAYFNNSLGVMPFPQAQWFLRVLNVLSTSSTRLQGGLDIKVPRSCALGDLNCPSKHLLTVQSFALLQCC